jgi:hypothetical protein
MNAINSTPKVASRAMMLAPSQVRLVDPHSKARSRLTMLGINKMVPRGSKLRIVCFQGIEVRISGMCKRNAVVIMVSMPRGMFIKKHLAFL